MAASTSGTTSGLCVATPSGSRSDYCQCVADLLRRITKLRRSEFSTDADDFTLVSPSDSHVWTKMFQEYFIVNAHCSLSHCTARGDDMLWYVRSNASFFIGTKQNPLEVYRRQSQKQPYPGDSTVNWEETVYLNLILQQIDYTVTVAVCTKTSPQNLQILRKNTQRVFPSPSRRRMDSKGESEEIAYPSIYFAIDGFEEIFADVYVRDGECVCVELVARDRYNSRESAVFLGSIRYEVLKQVYDTKASNSWQWAQKLTGTTQRRREFVRMRGPHGKGYAEMAVSRVPGMGFETPLAEQEMHFDDFETQAAEEYRSRRMSDTNLNRHMTYKSMRSGGNLIKKVQSEADYVNQYPEVDANTIDDGWSKELPDGEQLEEGVFSKLWTMRGFGQAWHWMREKRRAACTPLNSYLTYVTLPWNLIMDDLLDHPRRPVLTFEVELEPPPPRH